MSIPPFPSQDLAKLVLGYMAEEQLMTAYDEFLQASPYLDARKNEYDRIFMTSLKSILAEYRAVKIYVDTCKPSVLRKKLFQRTNLLDVVKFLVTNVDINKIQLQEATEKTSLDKPNTTPPQTNTCELCHSFKLANCICKSRPSDVQQAENLSLQNSVETTLLADLPGNHVTTKKKHAKILDKDSINLNSNVSSIQNSDSSAKQSFSSNMTPEEYLARCENSPILKSSDNSSLGLNSTVKALDPSKSKQNIEEFDDVLKSVVDRNKTLPGSECSTNLRISNASTFQDFASGVSSGENQSATYNVPDSSTSENLNATATLTKYLYNDNVKRSPQRQLLLQVSRVNDTIDIQTCREENPEYMKPLKSSSKFPKIQPKPVEKKIKIISDVKVGSKCSEENNDSIKKKPLVPKTATSTPLMQMQTIVINGMPAYKHTSKTHNYTKDEIMAMPTLIVVPASGPSQVPTSAHCDPIMTQNSDMVLKTSSSPTVLGPLVINVSPNTVIQNKPIVTCLPDLSEQPPCDLVKSVVLKNASVPKDNVISVETSTPHVLPTTRKSSSTPRRSSHIRVLDFSASRRILHESIKEQVSSKSSDPPVEIALSVNSDVERGQTISETVDIAKSDINNEEGNHNDNGSAKENVGVNKKKQVKKSNWDADLRALVANDEMDTTPDLKTKRISSKKKKSVYKTADSEKTECKNKKRSKKSPKVKKSKVRDKIGDEPPPLDKISDVPAKPTINIICGTDLYRTHENNIDFTDIKNKSHEEQEECIDTPETERLSLQNVIGAKLNISDLLETPYKQALYDIQMDTPKFMGPDLPDEPLSDIKIMNIPTPHFLNDPKPVQTTPSYSSRLTDYSSGGSYYKPDEQDYMPILDFKVKRTSSKEDISVEKSTEKDKDKRKSRPVRQCTKNISYYNSNALNKTKNTADNADVTSSCSDTISVNSSFEFNNKTESIPKTQDKCQSMSRTESKRRSSVHRKRKSPIKSAEKDKTKSFMKMKPRYTPKKDTHFGRNRKKMNTSPYSRGSPGLLQRIRTTSKEKPVNTTTSMVAIPIKSRRKSSTPRKLHCTKTFNSESFGHGSSENIGTNPNVNCEKSVSHTQDSDTEQLALRWSDDGSQDAKVKDITPKVVGNEIEDITKIQEFINLSDLNKHVHKKDENIEKKLTKNIFCVESGESLQRNLMDRGFDSETAKNIERDLLESTPVHTESTTSTTLPMSVETVEPKKDNSSLEKTVKTGSVTNELEPMLDETCDEIELSVHEFDEGSKNYFVFKHDDTKETSLGPPITLKDNFTMEICIDDMTMRLKATPFSLVFDQDPLTVDSIDYSYKETEEAVSSIINMDKLYTPLKDSIKAQCYEIFDSTLTSIDTPMKVDSPVRLAPEASVTDIILKEERDAKDKTELKKRKRLKSSDEPASSNKRTKPDAELLLKTANIQNIDIETVLTKLHGH